VIIALTLVPRFSAARSKAAQNSGSRLIEVGWPAMRTEYLRSGSVGTAH
jgi:hypothetical protein